MKIAAIATSVIPSSFANGIQVMKTCQALKQVNGEVCLWVPGDESTPWETLAELYGLETKFQIRWFQSTLRLRRYDLTWGAMAQARHWGVELVYTWMLQVAVLALWQGLPVILELHDLPTGKIGPVLFRLFASHQKQKRLLLITDALHRKVDQRFGMQFHPGEIQIAPNGVDLERYANLPSAPEARRQLGLPEGLTALYSGHFYSGRGMEILFGLALKFPQVNFLWLGGFPKDRENWQERLDSSGVHNVNLIGFMENLHLPLYQAAADIVLMPYERVITGSSGGNSAEICSPMKMFDYMASGRAILSSDLPVIREVLNNENAFFCPPENLEAWTAAFGKLLADPGLRAQKGEQARVDATKYSWRGRAERALQGMQHNCGSQQPRKPDHG